MTHDPQAQKEYWNHAGSVGYSAQNFVDQDVATHILNKFYADLLAMGEAIGLRANDSVIDLGCGDGRFSNSALASRFKAVHGIDFAEEAIASARLMASEPNVRFDVMDLSSADLTSLGPHDAVFGVGILHHIKPYAPRIVRDLAKIAPKVVVGEPNGSHIVRKMLEYLPSYRAAGEDSFRTRQITKLFSDAGYEQVAWQRTNLFPNFTPSLAFRLLKSVEPLIESTPLLRALCTINMYGFRLRTH